MLPISYFPLIDAQTEEAHHGFIRASIDEKNLNDVETGWKIFEDFVLQKAKSAKSKLTYLRFAHENFPSSHWTWRHHVEHTYADERKYLKISVVGEDTTHALAIIQKQYINLLRPNERTLYINLLDVAPWNRRLLHGKQRFKQVGTNLMYAIGDYSLSLPDCNGISLHALPEAEEFYQRFGLEKIAGADAACEDLPYYVITRDNLSKILA